jgi:hypothetical protein
MNVLQFGLTDRGLLAGALVLSLALILLAILSPQLRFKGKLVNDRSGFEFFWTNAKKRFQSGARTIFKSAFDKVRSPTPHFPWISRIEPSIKATNLVLDRN